MIMLNEKSHNSLIHNLNPFIKLMITFLFIVSCLLCRTITPILFLMLFLLIIILSSEIDIRIFTKLFPFSYLILFLIILDCLIFRSIYHTTFLALKVILIIFISAVMWFTTKKSEFFNALKMFLWPLSIFGVNVSKLIMKFRLLTKFKQIYLKENEKVIKSKNNRNSNETKKLKSKTEEKFSLFKIVFERSKQRMKKVNEIMLMRNYSFDIKRKNVYNLKTKEVDLTLIGMQILIFIAIIVKG